MKNLVWIILIKFLLLKGVHLHVTCVNLTTTSADIKLENSTTPQPDTSPSVVKELSNTTQVSRIPPEIHKIFQDSIDVLNNETVVNETLFGALNESLKSNYTLVAEAMELSGSWKNYRLEKTAAIVAGVFLASAIVAYTSCVGYRRYLQRKYGDKQRLAPEDVYDTSDLRYFEI